MTTERDDSRNLPPGYVVADRYELERSLGSGGMGAVYSARDDVLNGERVAIKILHTDLIENERQLQRFLREVQLMRRVNHRNVVRTFDVSSAGNLVYFTMEFVEGTPLESFIDDRSFPKRQLDKLIVQVCEGLEAIHRAGIIHRDLKPANILLLHDWTVKITDFGVARPQYSELTAHNEILGSALYIAPEIWLGTKMTPSVDLYSLGVLLYEVTTGTLPFDGDSPAALMRMHLEYEPPPPKELSGELPHWVNKLIVKLLAKSPLDRPADAREVIEYVKLHTDSQSRIEADRRSSDTVDEGFLRNMEQSSTRDIPPRPPLQGGTTAARLEAASRVKTTGVVRNRGLGEALAARGLSLLLICLLTLGLGSFIVLLASWIGDPFRQLDAIAAGTSPHSLKKVGVASTAVIAFWWFGALLQVAVFPSAIGALAGSFKTALRFLRLALLVEVLLTMLLLLQLYSAASDQGFALLNSVTLPSAARSLGQNLTELSLLSPVFTAHGRVPTDGGLLVVPDSLVHLWQSPSFIGLWFLQLLFIAFLSEAALEKGRMNPRNGALAAAVVFGLLALLSPLLGVNHSAGEAGAFVDPRLVCGIAWLVFYGAILALSLLSRSRRHA